MKKLAILFVVSVLIFSACKKDLEVMEPTPSPVQTTAMADLKVNTNFDWKTMKDIQVEIKSNTKAVLYLKSKTGVVYHKALANYGETYQTKITVPTFEKELVVVLGGQYREIPLTNDRISVSFP